VRTPSLVERGTNLGRGVLEFVPNVNLDDFNPKSRLGRAVGDCLPYLPRELAMELVDRLMSSCVVETTLSVVVFRACDVHGVWDCACPDRLRRTEDYGVVSLNDVTDDGVDFIVDAFQNATELENLKFHGIGTNTSPAVGQTKTTLGTELTTQYNPNSTRATGTTTEGASSNIFQTVGTNTVDASATIEEHGIFDQAAAGGGTLLDRHLTGTKSLLSGEGLQSTYDLTLTAGG